MSTEGHRLDETANQTQARLLGVMARADFEVRPGL